MTRSSGIVLGAVAFAIAYALERQFESVRKDIIRYDKIRAMSGDPPLLREVFASLFGMVNPVAEGGSSFLGFFESIQEDVARYVRIRSM